MKLEKMNENENSIISQFLNQFLAPIIKKTVEETLSQKKDSPKKETDDEIGVEEAARILRCSPGHIYNLTYKQMLPSYKKGKQLLFSRSQLTTWDEKRKKSSYHFRLEHDTR